MSKKIAFFSTIFPANKEFLEKFFNSLVAQTYNVFDVVIVNDGYDEYKLLTQQYPSLNIIILEAGNNPIENREKGINYCIDHKYDILIFGDSDDYFDNNRVEKSLELLEETDIVVNDLSLFDKNGIYEGKYLSHRLENLDVVDLEFIKDKNIFGLSNTAIKLDDIQKITIPYDLVAVDWYIFSVYLMSGKKAVFTNETVSYYRQRQQNIIGFKKIDESFFKKGVEIKRKHYEALNDKNNQFSSELKRLSNSSFSDREKINNPLWWELI